jgi:hypothetical protein
MWDEMVTMIVVEKDDKLMTTFVGAQTDVEGSIVIKAPKKQKKRQKYRKKRIK